MTEPSLSPQQGPTSFTSFVGVTRIAQGSLPDNARAVRLALLEGRGTPVLTFRDDTGEVIELDTRGDEVQVSTHAAALALQLAAPAPSAAPEGPRGRGRPRLGVVAREVTLLPRHWDWLSAQPGGASVTLRRLIDQARRERAPADRQRQAHERCYRVMQALAGHLPGYEEALRALFAGDRDRYAERMTDWPADLRDHLLSLATPEPDA